MCEAKLYEAIFFDFDGVLADSEPVHFESWREALQPVGIQLDWTTFAKYCIGVPDRDAVELLCRLNPKPIDVEVAWAQRDRKADLFAAHMLRFPPFSDEVIELVKSLSAYKLAVVTASSRQDIEPLLERAGIRSCFAALVCRDDVTRNKPAPDPYLLAARLVAVSHALVVEDSEPGAASGAAAGFDVLRVPSPAAMPRMVRERLDSFR